MGDLAGLVGSQLGRYELTKLLGEGGMGRVFLARDTVLGREVAIKVLRDDLGLPPEVRAHITDRMRIEARAVAAISHPNVIVLHDMGDDPRVGLFLVFEYVAGETLRARVERGPVAAAEVARLARELGSALDAAHAAGVLHRDVKPENVLLGSSGCKIGDFGLARVPDASITRSGANLVGTPAYAAPETLQAAAGSRGAFSAASDVFALAATLYEALTGKRAFPGEDLLSVVAAIGSATPRTIARAELDAERAAALNRAIVGRGLAKDPADRYKTTGELGDAVARALEPVDRSQVTPPRPAMHREVTGRAPRWLNFLVATGLIAGLALILVERRHRLLEASDAGTAPTARPRPRPPKAAPAPPRTTPSATPDGAPSAPAASARAD